MVRFGGEGERRVREEKRLLVGDDEGTVRERGFREETSMGAGWCGARVPFRGGLGGGEGGSVFCLREPRMDSLVVEAVGGSAEGCESKDLVTFGGVEMTPRALSCSEDGWKR